MSSGSPPFLPFTFKHPEPFVGVVSGLMIATVAFPIKQVVSRGQLAIQFGVRHFSDVLGKFSISHKRTFHLRPPLRRGFLISIQRPKYLVLCVSSTHEDLATTKSLLQVGFFAQRNRGLIIRSPQSSPTNVWGNHPSQINK